MAAPQSRSGVLWGMLHWHRFAACVPTPSAGVRCVRLGEHSATFRCWRRGLSLPFRTPAETLTIPRSWTTATAQPAHSKMRCLCGGAPWVPVHSVFQLRWLCETLRLSVSAIHCACPNDLKRHVRSRPIPRAFNRTRTRCLARPPLREAAWHPLPSCCRSGESLINVLSYP